jgi:signal transduction histidine kinase
LGNEENIEVLVQDSGSGIPKKMHKKVFNPGVTTKKRGWGLGLSLAKRIVEEYHGGKISLLKTGKKQGACFRIELPR